MPWADRWIRLPSASTGRRSSTPLMPSALSDLSQVWMSHGDRITRMPEGFIALARSDNSPFAAMGDMRRKYFGVQFHPEVRHTPNGELAIRHFAVDDLRGTARLDAGVHHRRGGGAHTQAGGRRTRAGGRQRRRGFIGGRRPGAPGHRRPARGGVCGYRPAARRARPNRWWPPSARRCTSSWSTVDAGAEFIGALQGVTEPEREAPDRRREVHPPVRRAGPAARAAAVPGAGHHLPGRGRVVGAGPEQGRAHQDPPQCRRPAGGHAVRAGGTAALPVQG